jgi:hypothetical protein
MLTSPDVSPLYRALARSVDPDLPLGSRCVEEPASKRTDPFFAATAGGKEIIDKKKCRFGKTHDMTQHTDSELKP